MHDDTDPFAAFVAPADPLNAADLDEHAGVLELRHAVRALDTGDGAAALEALTRARAHGVPAELGPYLATVHGCAALLTGAAPAALDQLATAWREHPDVAALPALLGIAQLLAEDEKSAAHTMYAALISDDPDRSLTVHRRRLTQLLGLLRAAR